MELKKEIFIEYIRTFGDQPIQSMGFAVPPEYVAHMKRELNRDKLWDYDAPFKREAKDLLKNGMRYL
jgi:hypothetical protein